MANRSYLYATSFAPADGDKKEGDRIGGLSEYDFFIPISYKILASQNAKVSQSIIWNNENPIAIQGDFKKGKERFFQFLEELKKEQIFDVEELEQYITETKTFLAQNQLEYIVLECGEIFLSEGGIEIQHQKLFEEVCNIDKTISIFLKKLKQMKASLDTFYEKRKQLYAQKEKRDKMGFIGKLFPSNNREIAELEMEIDIQKSEMHCELGINYWSDILYYDFSE